MDRIPPISVPLLRGTLTRRTLLSGAGVVALTGALAACGTQGTASNSKPASARAAKDLSDTDKRVKWSNWPEYIDLDEENGTKPTLLAFTKATGIKVDYTEDYNDNDEFFAKVKPQLQAGQDTGRDVWCSTDWMVARLIRLGWIQKLDKANIPNAENLEPDLQKVSFDPGRTYSLPWQSGFTGIAYNPKATGGRKVESIDQLLTDKSLRGKVTLLTEMRDTVPMVMLAQGKKPESFTAADFTAAIDAIAEAKESGQLRGFTGNEYGKPLVSGDTAACLAWTGDVVQLKADNPSLGYVLPSTGHMIWSDNFVIPNQAKRKKNAERLINFYYQPEVMAEVEAYVNYISPVKGAKEVLLKQDPDLAKNELIFPTEEVLARAHTVRGFTEEEETTFNRQFQDLIGA